ncbi:RNA ligase family protein [Saccharothrix sp. HUAS TT1]|uniref:RNA ligase family protein n=1 Tax=unclassified Saccharothrix TaxID=2593673 RepID=UPI00345C3456
MTTTEKENTMGHFVKWGSTPRFHKGLHVTEKIDGTNGCVIIYDGVVRAQSRKRLITPDDDNFGFARWVYDNAGALTDALGWGYHYGEWFGEGIQKNPLGIEGKRFALFNTWHWARPENSEKLEQVDGLGHVPVLYDEQRDGPAHYYTIPDLIDDLWVSGSRVEGAAEAMPDLWPDRRKRAEGIIVWHRESQQKYKILLEDDDAHKWEKPLKVVTLV